MTYPINVKTRSINHLPKFRRVPLIVIPLGKLMQDGQVNSSFASLPGLDDDNVLMKYGASGIDGSEWIIVQSDKGFCEVFDIRDSRTIELKLVENPSDNKDVEHVAAGKTTNRKKEARWNIPETCEV